MLTPEQLTPGLIPGRPGTARPAIVAHVNGLPVRLSIMQKPAQSRPGAERHSIGVLFDDGHGKLAWGPLGEWRWEAN